MPLFIDAIMSVRFYAFKYVCIYVIMRLCLYFCVHLCRYVLIMYVVMRLCINAFLYVCVHAFMHLWLYLFYVVMYCVSSVCLDVFNVNACISLCLYVFTSLCNVLDVFMYVCL